MTDHRMLADAIADVPWLARSRDAYRNWAARLALLAVGCAVLAAAIDPAWTAASSPALETIGLVIIGLAFATAGLLLGATYGRIVAALSGALALGHAPHWLAARVASHEDDAAALVAELELLASGTVAR